MFSDLRDAFGAVPANRMLGLQLLERSSQRCVIGGEVRPEYTQEHGVTHGAIVTAFADTAAVWLFHPDLADGESMASIEFKVNFLSSGFIDKGPLTAEAVLVRRGKRIGVAQSDVRQGDAHIARGLFTYMFFRQGQS